MVQKNWLKGLVAVSNRFSVPKGAIPFMVNLLLAERGSLQACDGSAVNSTISAPPGPILDYGVFVDTAFTVTKIAIIQKTATTINLYNINAAAASLLAGTGDITITSGWLYPQLFQFNNALILSLGNNVTPDKITSIGAAPAALVGTADWQANTQYYHGDVVRNTAHTITAKPESPLGAVGLGNPIGISGTVEPAWSTNLGDRTPDNTINWETIGSTTGGPGGGPIGNVNIAKNSAPLGAAHMIQHAGALWAFNTNPTTTTTQLNGPSILRQSAIGNFDSWPEVNATFIGKDDGTAGTGIAVFTIAEAGIAPTASLVLFKDFTTYQVTGLFRASNFAIQQVKSDMGCVAPRSPKFATGFGILRLAHLGVALFDGVADTLISEEIRPYVYGGFGITGMDISNMANAKGTLCVNPPLYLLAIPMAAGGSNYYGIAGGDGSLIRVLCYDLVMKAWAVVDLPFKISALNQFRITGQKPLTVAGGFSDGKTRQLQAGDTTFDTGDTINWKFTTPTVGQPTARNYFRRAQIRLHAPATPTLTVQPIFDAEQPSNSSGAAGAAEPSSSQIGGVADLTVATYESDNDFMVLADLGQTASSARADISGSGKATIESVEWQAIPKKPRAAGVQL